MRVKASLVLKSSICFSYRRKGFACDISIAQSEDEGWTDFSFFISFVFATIVVPSAIM